MTNANVHIPVLFHEVMDALRIQPGNWYLDGTFGRGGHTRGILQRGGKVLAMDVDLTAIEAAQATFQQEIVEGQLAIVRENFDQLSKVAVKFGVRGKLNGILLDFGVSSPQIDTPERGFSFQHDAELDMRMDDRLGVKAKDLLALLSERQLADLFAEHGEDANRKIAREIVYRRKKQVITTTQQLAHLIEEVKPGHRGHLHPATKVFQALRVAVNGELDSIHQVLPQAFAALTEGGRLVTISFHEGEDRIVKNFFNQEEDEGKAVHLTHKVITASEQELEENQRSRSAKLRILEKKAL